MTDTYEITLKVEIPNAKSFYFDVAKFFKLSNVSKVMHKDIEGYIGCCIEKALKESENADSFGHISTSGIRFTGREEDKRYINGDVLDEGSV